VSIHDLAKVLRELARAELVESAHGSAAATGLPGTRSV
jgi:hypothetical protein